MYRPRPTVSVRSLVRRLRMPRQGKRWSALVAAAILALVAQIYDLTTSEVSDAASELRVYRDSLADGWDVQELDADLELRATPAYKGSRAMSLRIKKNGGGLRLRSEEPLRSTRASSIQFAVRAGEEGQRLAIAILDDDGRPLDRPRSLNDFGGSLSADKWKHYKVRLSELEADGRTIGGLQLLDARGRTESEILLDEIAFSGVTEGSPSATPTPRTTSTPTRTVSPKAPNAESTATVTATRTPSPATAASGGATSTPSATPTRKPTRTPTPTPEVIEAYGEYEVMGDEPPAWPMEGETLVQEPSTETGPPAHDAGYPYFSEDAVSGTEQPVVLDPSLPFAPPVQGGATSPVLGLLGVEPERVGEVAAAGVQLVQLEVSWASVEPVEGGLDRGYVSSLQSRLQAFQDAGMQVVLDPGLHSPPAWLLEYPNSRYVNQRGELSEAINLTFSTPLRQKATAYLEMLARELDLTSFAAVRIGAGGLPELLYPSGPVGETTPSFWAFDANAQGGLERPSSIPGPPFPGWMPGEALVGDQPATAEAARAWYDWYLSALADGAAWQIDTLRRLGFQGQVLLIMPGQGLRPAEHAEAIETLLGQDSSGGLLGRGAVWSKLLEALTGRPGLVAYSTSVADGTSGEELCEPGDTLRTWYDPAVGAWSSTRWLVANAMLHGVAVMGENAGRESSPGYGLAMLEAAVLQANSCGLQALVWSDDGALRDPSSGVTLADYAAAAQQGAPSRGAPAWLPSNP